MTRLNVLILTMDEEKNLPFALQSLSGLNARIFVVDSGSTDATCEIAVRHGCEVFFHPFENQARQVNWALDNLSFDNGWIMRLDADERLSDRLAEEVVETLPLLPSDITGLMIKRRVYFWGRWIRHGGYYPTWLLRIWRTGSARCEDRAMDEHMLMQHGLISRLKNDIIDENHKSLAFWIDKHNRFSDREVLALRAAQKNLTTDDAGAPTSRKRQLKNNFYGRFPMFVRALLYWFLRYFVLFGFLDGRAGFVFHFLQGFWYRLVIDAKLYELQRAGEEGKNDRPRH
jgi:glycosyltransferase involved in cell wall biosynthesis